MKTWKKAAVLLLVFFAAAVIYFLRPAGTSESHEETVYTVMEEAALPVVYPVNHVGHQPLSIHACCR